jgi:antitoxin YefM
MPNDTTYTHLRDNLARVLDEVVDQQEVVIVRRRGARDVALMPASELAALMERLRTALRRAERGAGKPSSGAQLRREILGEA